MLMPTLSILGLVAAAAASCPNDLQTPYPAPVADGNYTVRLVANAGLSKPRSLLFDNGGALLVLDSNVGVVRMTLEDHGGSCVTVANTTKVLEDKAVSCSSFSLDPLAVSVPAEGRTRGQPEGKAEEIGG